MLMPLPKTIYDQIVKVILDYKKPEQIMVFGSQARGDQTATSDIDIAIRGRGWTARDINLVKDALEECIKTPLTLDVLHFDSLKNERLRQKILNEGRIIYGS